MCSIYSLGKHIFKWNCFCRSRDVHTEICLIPYSVIIMNLNHRYSRGHHKVASGFKFRNVQMEPPFDMIYHFIPSIFASEIQISNDQITGLITPSFIAHIHIFLLHTTPYDKFNTGGGMFCCWFMMTSSNGNNFRVTYHLCGEFTGLRWLPRTKASDAELWYFFIDLRLNNRLSKHWWGWWFETPSLTLWRQCNVYG